MDNEQPVSVVQALSRVMAELPAIGKDERAPANMGGYAFRGIEAMTRVIQPLLAKHGVVIVPRASLGAVEHAPDAKPAWQDTYLTVEWAIFGPDGSSIEARTIGCGRDHTDKGAPKAATQAFKALLLQLFCVSDATDDADGHDYTGQQYDDEPAEQPYGAQVFDELTVAGKDDPRLAALLRQYAIDNDRKLTARALVDDQAWAEQVHAAMRRYLDERAARAAAIQADIAAQAEAIADGDTVDAPPGAVEVGA